MISVTLLRICLILIYNCIEQHQTAKTTTLRNTPNCLVLLLLSLPLCSSLHALKSCKKSSILTSISKRVLNTIPICHDPHVLVLRINRHPKHPFDHLHSLDYQLKPPHDDPYSLVLHNQGQLESHCDDHLSPHHINGQIIQQNLILLEIFLLRIIPE